MASLGFNQPRRRRQSNLSGGVVGTTVPAPIAPVVRRSPTVTKTSPSGVVVVKPKPAIAPSMPPQELHWVYATVAEDSLRDDAGRHVADPGDSVLLVYPMRRDDDTGRVFMRHRAADPTTGQLTDTWVAVYDAETKRHLVRDFRV